MDATLNTLGQHLPLKSVEPSRTNPRQRFSETRLGEMAESIRQQGVIQPILVRPHPDGSEDKYEIVAGESRYRASKLAGKDTIPAVIRELTDLDALTLQVMENKHREDLHPLEEARGFKQLLEKTQQGDLVGYTVEDLAAKLSVSKSHVYGSLKLTELCVYAQDMFYDDKIKKDTAILIARIPGHQLQEQATREVIKGYSNEPMSVRAAKAHIHDRYTLELNKAPFDRHSTTLVADAGSCLSCPKRSGNFPELYSDIESADVCTDTECFAAKKLAHRTIIINQPGVISGEEVETIFPYSRHWASSPWQLGTANYSSSTLGLDKPFEELLGDDMPEATTVVFDDGEVKKVYIQTALTEKIKAKIESGEIILPKPKPAQVKKQEEEQRQRSENDAQAEELTRANRVDFDIAHYKLSIINQENLTELFRDFAIRALAQLNHHSEEALALNWKFPGIDWAVNLKDLSQADLIKILIESTAAKDVWVSPHWLETKRENLNSLIAELETLSPSSISISATTPPPAAPAEGNDARENQGDDVLASPGPWDAWPGDEVAEDAESTDTAALAEKVLSPKLQKIKDDELARRARRAKGKDHNESAGADGQTGVATATQTSEVAP